MIFSSDYETFLRRHFGSIHRWCAARVRGEVQVALLAQKVALDLYRAMEHASVVERRGRWLPPGDEGTTGSEAV